MRRSSGTGGVVRVAELVVQRVEDGQAVSRPTRSSSANGPIGKLQPPFMAVSMSSIDAVAVLEHPHRVVEVREQQGVDDEAGLVLDLDRVLAARLGERRRRGDRLVAGA